MMLLIATTTITAASLIGISTIYQALPLATAQSQQQTQISRTLVGTIDSFTFYSSSDGKACIAFAVISESITKLYHQTPSPLGLKPGNDIALLVPDQTMCVILSQANIASLCCCSCYHRKSGSSQHTTDFTTEPASIQASSGHYVVIYRNKA
jgi:hypothetical protein